MGSGLAGHGAGTRVSQAGIVTPRPARLEELDGRVTASRTNPKVSRQRLSNLWNLPFPEEFEGTKDFGLDGEKVESGSLSGRIWRHRKLRR